MRAITPFVLLVCLLTAGCNLWSFKSKPQTSSPKESAPVEVAGKKTDSAIVKVDEKTSQIEEQTEIRDSKLKADVVSARTENQNNPPGNPRTLVDMHLSVAESRLSGRPDPIEMAESAKRKTLVEQGKAEEARANTERAIASSNAQIAQLANLKTERDNAVIERDNARAGEAKALANYSAQMLRNQAEHDRAMQKALDEQRNEFLKNMGYALIAAGSLCVIIGVFLAYSKFQTGDLVAAITAAAFWAGGASFFFVCAWTINQWWFKWVVISGGALGITATAVYAIFEFRNGKTTKTRIKEADEAETVLKKVMTVVESEHKADAPIFEKLGRLMSDPDKALLHELKAESQRVPSK